MKLGDFAIGGTFWCGDGQWQCTDIGTRTVAAIRLDQVKVAGSAPKANRTLDRAAAETEGWFDGPPYAVPEIIFDEDDQLSCEQRNEAAI